MTQAKLKWQSKLVLMIVMPAVAAHIVLETQWWASQATHVAIWTIGISALLGLIAFQTRSATAAASCTGAAITASLMFSTVSFPYVPWRTALIPVLAVMVLTSIATRIGRSRKVQLGTAEARKGRAASQVAANLGAAALLSCEVAQTWMSDRSWLQLANVGPTAIFTVGLAALCEATADTVSSELGQVLNGNPRMITTLRRAEPGADGAISLEGTIAGILAACLVAALGTLAFGGPFTMLALSWAGGVFGLLFDSLLGATLEQRGLLNNDGVNFLSTLSASAFALFLFALLPRFALN